MATEAEGITLSLTAFRGAIELSSRSGHLGVLIGILSYESVIGVTHFLVGLYNTLNSKRELILGFSRATGPVGMFQLHTSSFSWERDAASPLQD